ncbi:MAG: hypothetical protein JRC93_09120 [Deltaproteobacteria bacterium]|nr:hypothetical protein [Deltaproteobacteria bacterium]
MAIQEAAIRAVMPYLVIGAVVVGAVILYQKEIGAAGGAIAGAVSDVSTDIVGGYIQTGAALERGIWGDPVYDYEATARAREPPTGTLKEFYESLHIVGPADPGYPVGIPSVIQPGAVENLAAAGRRLREEQRFKGLAGGVGQWFENLDKIVKIWG